MQEQVCNKCNVKKNISGFYIRPLSGRRRKDCKECVSQRSKEYKQTKIQAIIDKGGHDYNVIHKQRKECFKCKKIKLGKFFYSVFERPDGLSCYCKACDRKYTRDRIFKSKEFVYTDDELQSIIKICNKCKKEKKLICFGRSGKRNDGVNTKCKECCNKETQKRRNSKGGKLSVYKHGAKSRNIGWQLTDNEFFLFWQKPCSYCGGSISTIGLDRADSSREYSLDNIKSCCTICNKMKLQLSEKEWISHMKKIIKNIEAENNNAKKN
jgi:hypothetical protein